MKQEFLSLIGAAEKQSEHPLAEAIVQGIHMREISLGIVQEFEAVPGYGVKAIVDQKEILVGTRKLMNQHHVDITEALSMMEDLEENRENGHAS